MKRGRLVAIGWVVVLAGIGCEDGQLTFDWTQKNKEPDIEDKVVFAELGELATSLAYRDTVAEQGWFEGLRKMRVRGFGIVVGLGDRGSIECPPTLRERLIQDIRKRGRLGGWGATPTRISPERFLDDMDTAVVAVQGEIPAGARKGGTFDVRVRALPGTQTVSLEGGRLYSTDLHMFRVAERGASVEGRVLATASGPIFMNPFVEKDGAATRTNPREGVIIGGGQAKQSRRIRFVLSRPSYQRVSQIARRINARFPGPDPTAQAQTPSNIGISIPRWYRDDRFHFLALVRHLFLPERPGFAQERAAQLAGEILDPKAPHANIALAWEGIGRTILPIVQELYADPRPHVSFYAALAGLRMEDELAVEIVGRFAQNTDSPYHQTATEELGRADRLIRAAIFLRTLLNDPDPRVRVNAYKELQRRGDHTIKSVRVGGDGFFLDQVPCDGPNIIYVRRTESRRIALLGSDIRCKPPVFYRDEHGLLTLNAAPGNTNLTLIRRTSFGGQSSPALSVPLDVADLLRMLGDDPERTDDGRVHGLALDHTFVTRLMYELCRTGSINAKFLLERPTVTDVFGPQLSPDRPETD